MKANWNLLAILIAISVSTAQADLKKKLGLAKGDTIVIGGDSITAAQMHADYLAAWMQLSYPELDLKTYVIARSGSSLKGWATAPPVPPRASSTGLWERYCEPFGKLDHVFLMHGHNGGQDAKGHLTSYQNLWNTWVSRHRNTPNLIMLGMHSTQTKTDRKRAGGKADQEASFAAEHGKRFASNTDDHFGAIWRRNDSNKIDVRQTMAKPFHGSKDVVHCGPAGHIALTWAYLKGLAVDPLVSEVQVDGTTGEVAQRRHCTISKVEVGDDHVSFDRLDEKLPWAVDEVGRANAEALFPGLKNWQRYLLSVSGLKAGSYHISIDGAIVRTATAADLASGINLANVTSGPVWQQGQTVLKNLRLLAGYDPQSGARLKGKADDGTLREFHAFSTIHYQNGGQRGAAYVKSMAPIVDSLPVKLLRVHEAAQPVPRRWRVELRAKK